MLDKRSAIFSLYCVALLSAAVLTTAAAAAAAAAKRSTYDSYAAPENGTCYKRVPYDEAVIANLSQGLIKTESTTPPPGIQTWITIIDCCDGYQRDEYSGNCEFYCSEGCIGGNCTGPNECTCENGWRAERGECRPVCRQRCPRNAYCFGPDECNCLFGFEEINNICQPICQHECRNGDCVGPADCRCHRGYLLNATQHCEPICESGCPHGVCVAPGVCSCNQGYVNQLYESDSCVPECPPECINGECVTPNVCTCKAGYTQNDNGTCEARCEQTCPENGLCVATNQCGCMPGFILDSRGKSCVELPKNFPSRNNQGQFYGVNNANNPQQNRPYGTQRPNYGRTNYPNNQGGVYQTDNPYGHQQTEEPVGVVGLQDHVTTQRPQEGFYDNYGGRPTPGPQRPFTQQGTYSTSTPYPQSGSRGGIGSSTTYRPPTSDPRYTTPSPFSPLYPTQNPNQGSNGVWYPGQPQYGYGNQGNRPSQGSFGSRPPQTYHTTLSPFQPDEPRPTDQPQYGYGNRGNRPPTYSTQAPFGSRPPQTYHTTLSPFDPDEPRPTDVPYGPHDSHTQNPWRPTDRPQYGVQGNRGNNSSQGPFGSRPPQTYHTTLSPFHPDEPRPTDGPYGPRDPHRQNPWRPTQSPFQPDEPFPTEGPYGPYDPHTNNRNPYDRRDPNGQRTPNNNRPYNPYAPNNPRDQEGVKTGHGRPPYEPQQPYSPHRPYNPYAPANPQGTQGVKTSYGRPPFPPGSPYNPRPTQEGGLGVKGAQRPPGDIYSRSSVMHSDTQSGIAYSYGIDHLNGRTYNGQQPSPGSFIVTDPYVQPGNNVGGIIIIDSQQPPSVSQLQAICDGPCINSHCIGLNLCMCEIGFIPDPRNPNGNVCVPL